MKRIFNILVFVFLSTSIYGQKEHHEVIIDLKPEQPSVVLLETTQYTTTNFNAFKYSLSLNKKIKGFDFNISALDVISNGFFNVDSKFLRRSNFENYNINFKRTELQRLLPRLPEAIDFCPTNGY
jgi:hypothetical protein